ncbi:MAG: outer membrane beta-barrel protein [Pseudolabrys sp.]|nr:outer membrane beta-barrel protein [Pseudolabrys sp.]
MLFEDNTDNKPVKNSRQFIGNAPFLPFRQDKLSARYDQKMPWFGTVRGRLGYAQDSWLLYTTGGYAYTRLETEASATAGAGTATLSQHDFRNGWAIGGGIEVALMQRWSLKAEYLYMDFGKSTTTWAVPGLPTLTDTTKLNMNLVRVGVNYRF